MKKITKIVARVFPIVLVGLLVISNVMATGIAVPNLSGGSDKIGKVTDVAYDVWGTVLLVLRVLAVAAVVFAGIRYMFASASDKADIKKQLVILVVGAVLVFGATFIIGFIANASKNINELTQQ